MNTVIASGHRPRGDPAGSGVLAAGLLRGLRPLAMTTLLLLTACASPEATRTRGGGPGADVKNWNQPVELHAGAEMYYETPCATEPVECNGPPPVFGPTPPPD
jgi:hypothetical protein